MVQNVRESLQAFFAAFIGPQTGLVAIALAPGESYNFPTTSTRQSDRPVLRPSLSTIAHLPGSLVSHQDRHSSPDPRHLSILSFHSARPSPPVTLLHSILRLEDAPLQSPFQHHLQHPLVRFFPIIQRAKTDLTAPAAKILPRLATRRSNATPHQPGFPRLLH
jgi:hypothetical protein